MARIAFFATLAVIAGCSAYAPPVSDKNRSVASEEVTFRNTPGISEGGIPDGTRYTVQPGDTLFGVAFQFDLDPERFAAANNLPALANVQTGQRLVLSEAEVPARIAPQPARENRAPEARPAPPSPAPARSQSSPPLPPSDGRWAWPVDGQVLQGFSTRERFSRSLRIKGELGEPVRAARDGRVVYAGDGLVGLGNLVLIRHDSEWLSAYGHNDALLVQVNQDVKRGETIARLGSTGTDSPRLHFEVRQDGAPIDPKTVLPDR